MTRTLLPSVSLTHTNINQRFQVTIAKLQRLSIIYTTRYATLLYVLFILIVEWFIHIINHQLSILHRLSMCLGSAVGQRVGGTMRVFCCVIIVNL